MMQNILFVLLSLFLGGFGAWIIHNYGYKLGIVDVPNERSSHTIIIPKGGGIGILAAFVFCALFFKISETFWGPALCLSIVSFWGDRHEISPKFRLIIQFACSTLFLVAFFYYMQVYFEVYFLVLPLAVFIVGTSNFYNFMDGINGIAGITGVIGFLLLALYGFLSGADSVYITLCISTAFSCVGFLPFNIPSAKVFMGDIGSILLGFVFACMVVILSRSFLDFICMAGFLFPFYADELTTMLIRVKDGESLSQPHRRHLYQILANEYGIDHWKISSAYGMVQLVVGGSIFIVKSSGIGAIMTVLLLYLLLFMIFSWKVRLDLKSVLQ